MKWGMGSLLTFTLPGLLDKRMIYLLITLVSTVFLFGGFQKAPTVANLDVHAARNLRANPITPLSSVKARKLEGKPIKSTPSAASPTDVYKHAYLDKSMSIQKEGNTDLQVCDYTKGRWVYDDKRPLYSGNMCKRWLAGMWACRLTQRIDFSYEKYKWQPDHCEMPEFKGTEFLSRMRNKTVAFIGDSIGRQQFQSMMCLITGGEDMVDVQDVGNEYGLSQAQEATRPNGWAFRFPNSNTTILYYWSASLCHIEPINPEDLSTGFAMHLDRPVAFLCDNLHRFEVVVLNTGHHWNRGKVNANKWIMYLHGEPLSDNKLRRIHNAHNLTLHSLAKWLDTQYTTYPNMRAFMRSLSPRHFFNGEWNSGGTCGNTVPLTRANQSSYVHVTDPVTKSAVEGTKVELLDITAISHMRDEAHISKYSITSQNGTEDCLHWCLPGVPDTWNELLFSMLMQKPKPDSVM